MRLHRLGAVASLLVIPAGNTASNPVRREILAGELQQVATRARSRRKDDVVCEEEEEEEEMRGESFTCVGNLNKQTVRVRFKNGLVSTEEGGRTDWDRLSGRAPLNSPNCVRVT